MPRKYNLNAKTITAPLAAFTMATLLFVYSRMSIQAAKRNAQIHREADGGQINWNNESLRRHGLKEPPIEQESLKQLVGLAKERAVVEKGGETEEEKLIRERAGRGRGA